MNSNKFGNLYNKVLESVCLLQKVSVRLFLCLLISGLSVNMYSQEILKDTLSEVTVRGVRKPIRSMEPMPVQSVEAEELMAQGIQSIADAIKHFSGTTVRDYGGIGGMKTVSVRSLGAYHTGVSYDGVAVSNLIAGQIDIGRFSMDHVGVISLSVGQDSQLLQSARLLESAAVLSISSDYSKVSSTKPWAIDGAIRVGSFGEMNGDARWTQQINKQTIGSFNIQAMHADGDYPFTLKNGELTEERTRKNSDVDQRKIEANLIHQFNDSSRLDTKVYYYYNNRGLPGSVILYNEESYERLLDETFFVQTVYKKEWGSKWSMQSQAKYGYGYNRYQDRDVAQENNLRIQKNKQQEYYVNTTIVYSPNNSWSFSWANDGIYNTLKNNSKWVHHPERWTWLTGLTARWQQHNIQVLGTLLHTVTFESAGGVAPPDNQNEWTPSIALRYTPIQGVPWHVRALYKRSYRLPNFTDLYYEEMGNTKLVPETADEYNLGTSYTLASPSTWWDYLSVHVDAYINKVDNKIVAFPTTYVWKMRNFGRVDITGVDLSADTRLFILPRYTLDMNASYTFQKAVDKTDSSAKNYNDQIPYTPKNRYSVGATLSSPYGTLSYTILHEGERYYQPQNIPVNKMNAYDEHSVTYSLDWTLAGIDCRWSVSCINMFDEQYDIVKFYPMPGRSWKSSVRFSF